MKNKLHRTFIGILKITLFGLLMASVALMCGALWSIVSSTAGQEPVEPIRDNRQSFVYSVTRYTLFDLEQFDFRFILADIRIESNKAINLSLSNFRTSENIQLNSVASYFAAIDEAGYNLDDYQIASALMSSSTSLDALLFIPVVDDSLETIDVNVTLHPVETLSFDLNNPGSIGAIEDVASNEPLYEESELAAVSFVWRAMIDVEQLYHLDELGEKTSSVFTSKSQVLGVKVNIKNLGLNELQITKASVSTKAGASYVAMDGSHLMDGVDNIVDEAIPEDLTGYLFFEVLGETLTLGDFTTVEIYLSDMSKEIMIALSIEERQ